MTLPPYPGPEGSSGDEPQKPENPETPGEQPPGPTHQPYGQPQQPENPYGQQPPAPYGQQPPAPYGQQPPAYGYGAYAGANEASRGWSGTAIASFVTSLLCCGIPAVILGIIAIFKTGEGKGKGRWMAVTGMALGAVGTIAATALFVGGYWFFSNVVTPENAEVGQCVDTDYDEDENTVFLLEVDCDDPHDAEIFGVVELTQADLDAFESGEQGQLDVCSDAVDDELSEATNFDITNGEPTLTLKGEDLKFDAVLADPEDPEVGDDVACYIEARSGDLDEKLLD